MTSPLSEWLEDVYPEVEAEAEETGDGILREGEREKTMKGCPPGRCGCVAAAHHQSRLLLRGLAGSAGGCPPALLLQNQQAPPPSCFELCAAVAVALSCLHPAHQPSLLRRLLPFLLPSSPPPSFRPPINSVTALSGLFFPRPSPLAAWYEELLPPLAKGGLDALLAFVSPLSSPSLQASLPLLAAPPSLSSAAPVVVGGRLPPLPCCYFLLDHPLAPRHRHTVDGAAAAASPVDLFVRRFLLSARLTPLDALQLLSVRFRSFVFASSPILPVVHLSTHPHDHLQSVAASFLASSFPSICSEVDLKAAFSPHSSQAVPSLCYLRFLRARANRKGPAAIDHLHAYYDHAIALETLSLPSDRPSPGPHSLTDPGDHLIPYADLNLALLHLHLSSSLSMRGSANDDSSDDQKSHLSEGLIPAYEALRTAQERKDKHCIAQALACIFHYLRRSPLQPALPADFSPLLEYLSGAPIPAADELKALTHLSVISSLLSPSSSALSSSTLSSATFSSSTSQLWILLQGVDAYISEQGHRQAAAAELSRKSALLRAAACESLGHQSLVPIHTTTTLSSSASPSSSTTTTFSSPLLKRVNEYVLAGEPFSALPLLARGLRSTWQGGQFAAHRVSLLSLADCFLAMGQFSRALELLSSLASSPSAAPLSLQASTALLKSRALLGLRLSSQAIATAEHFVCSAEQLHPTAIDLAPFYHLLAVAALSSQPPDLAKANLYASQFLNCASYLEKPAPPMR